MVRRSSTAPVAVSSTLPAIAAESEASIAWLEVMTQVDRANLLGHVLMVSKAWRLRSLSGHVHLEPITGRPGRLPIRPRPFTPRATSSAY